MYDGIALMISSRDQIETQLLDYPIHQRRLLVSSIRPGCPHLLEALTLVTAVPTAAYGAVHCHRVHELHPVEDVRGKSLIRNK
jgi:hypothetical protein